jgi:hypothetical protein
MIWTGGFHKLCNAQFAASAQQIYGKDRASIFGSTTNPHFQRTAIPPEKTPAEEFPCPNNTPTFSA